MKRKFIKKTVSVLLSVLLVLTLTLGISAHEMYYTSSGTPIVLRWTNTYSGKPFLQVNGDGLAGCSYEEYNYSNEYNAVWSAWNSCAGLVVVERASLSNSSVDFVVPSYSTWRSLVGNNREFDVHARTILKATDRLIYSSSDASASSKNIIYATIYMNPYIQQAYQFDGLDTLDIRHVIVHEMGHALTLGHSNAGPYASSVASVMQEETFAYIYPQSHDISDIQAKYG
ncbi:MAG: hypothetical protein J6M16_06430 [Clostridia bacterium]|nr:hypothetical protein [Clostridia bacterium]